MVNKRFDGWFVISIIMLLLFIAVLIYPMFGIIKQSVVMPDGSLSWEQFQKFFGQSYYFKTIVNSFNVRLNGLAAREFILGGRIEFLETENALTDLMDGILRFHIYFTPPPPAEQIVGILEFDPRYFSTLFESVG